MKNDQLRTLEQAVKAAKQDPHGGKVLLPLYVAEALMKALRR